MGACFARVQRIAAQEELIKAQDMHIKELTERLVEQMEVNEIRFMDLVEAEAELCRATEEIVLLKRLMSDVSN